MATGTVTVFNDARVNLIADDWASTDTIKLAILDATTPPTAADVAPELLDYTEVTAAGTYTAGGYTLDTLVDMVSQTGGVMKFDSDTIPTWTANASNDDDAYWAYIYNDAQTGDPGICFIELGGPIDMKTIPLTITFAANGIFTI